MRNNILYFAWLSSKRMYFWIGSMKFFFFVSKKREKLSLAIKYASANSSIMQIAFSVLLQKEIPTLQKWKLVSREGFFLQ